MTSRIGTDLQQIKRAAQIGVRCRVQMERLTRGRAHSDMEQRIITRRKKDFPTMPVDELRVACIDLCDRNEQLEHVLRKMLGTVQVGLIRGDFGVDTLQELYESWRDAA